MVEKIKERLNGSALPLYRGFLFTMIATLVAGGVVFYGEMHQLRGSVESFMSHQVETNADIKGRLTWLEHTARLGDR